MIDGLISQRSAVGDSHTAYNDVLSRPLGLIGGDTGLHTINMITGGHVAGNITTLASRAGHGKTAVITPMSEAAKRVLNGKRSELLVASWEMTAPKLVDRYICYKTGLSLMQLKYAKVLTPEQRKIITDAYQQAMGLPIHYHPYSTDIDTVVKILIEFTEKVRRMEIVQGVKIQPVFVLDYIGRAKGSTKYANRTYDLQNFLYGVKQVCNQTGLSAFILAQINRSADTMEQPEVYHLSDSASIEQASDNVILLDRPEVRGQDTLKDPATGGDMPSKDKAILRVVKARETAPCDVLVNCDMKNFDYWDINHKRGFQYWDLYKDRRFWETHFGI